MSQQQTLRQSVSYSGIGLHSGNRVTMSLLPAPPNSGIRFRRVDLEGKPEIEARIENVSQTSRSTTLTKGNAKIQTVEHVLATLAGYGIDNAVIEVDANEPPIGDGSAREYCKMVEHAGLAPQAERREAYRVTEPLHLQTEETLSSIFPHDRLKISCTSADKAGRFSQFYTVEIAPETWKREIAHARTFCFFEEIEYLIKNGLIKGGSLENAVVIRDDAVLTTEPLRYPEEFVRHKILDILGDLSLLGRPVCGHVVAVRPSHSANCELTRLIQSQMRRPLETIQTFAPPPPVVDQPAAAAAIAEIEKMMADGSSLDITQLMKVLPHRYPFLMVDKVTRIEGNKITAVKNVSVNEPYFLGHFPNHPIMPGVLQLEAIAQVAGILMLRQAENFGKLAYFMSAESVRWRKPVRPGDSLVIDVELTKSRGKIGRARGVCSVAQEVVSEAEVTFMLIDRQA
ncbi:MAG TPA: bifunctional UDP-3-O-[3-hydroxymyristoyl] N-acetylglucosamine deacetylase/3-hydroxyacyl-ACP dehydratase [Candidatus Binatia bacterium]|nr:bifunctional UDP-3-O-[3-hydroxymyristoyl] N-acetylglucosamine deacetylase/3-hydroxyacyl-ACP dehydratase [Candidatus Binatia bacterium]